ncbi:MAG: hypothetical protein ABL935_04520, partial [Nitrospiraceae bacterium]
MITNTRWVSRGWWRIILLATVFLTGSSMPSLAEPGSPNLWQTLTEAGTTARDQARYEDAERLFLL